MSCDWNWGVQELLTEFKKLVMLKIGDVANSAGIPKCREISHIVKFGIKIQQGELFLGAGWLDYPQIWSRPSVKDLTYDFLKISIFSRFLALSRWKFWHFSKMDQIFTEKSARNGLKIEIFKKAYVRSFTLMRWRSGPNFTFQKYRYQQKSREIGRVLSPLDQKFLWTYVNRK